MDLTLVHDFITYISHFENIGSHFTIQHQIILFTNIITDLCRKVSIGTLSVVKMQFSSFHLKARILSLATILLRTCFKVRGSLYLLWRKYMPNAQV